MTEDIADSYLNVEDSPQYSKLMTEQQIGIIVACLLIMSLLVEAIMFEDGKVDFFFLVIPLSNLFPILLFRKFEFIIMKTKLPKHLSKFEKECFCWKKYFRYFEFFVLLDIVILVSIIIHFYPFGDIGLFALSMSFLQLS